MSSKSEKERREKIRIKNAEYQTRKEKRLSEQEYAKREQERLHKAELKKLEESGEWICKPKKNAPKKNAPVLPVLPLPVPVPVHTQVQPNLDLSIIDSVEDTDIKWTKQKINWAESESETED